MDAATLVAAARAAVPRGPARRAERTLHEVAEGVGAGVQVVRAAPLAVSGAARHDADDLPRRLADRRPAGVAAARRLPDLEFGRGECLDRDVAPRRLRAGAAGLGVETEA